MVAKVDMVQDIRVKDMDNRLAMVGQALGLQADLDRILHMVEAETMTNISITSMVALHLTIRDPQEGSSTVRDSSNMGHPRLMADKADLPNRDGSRLFK
jgi:hypothetical protein